MGLLSRLFGRGRTQEKVYSHDTGLPKEKPADLTHIWITGNGTFEVPIVGESHYQKALESLAGGRTPDGLAQSRAKGRTLELDATLVLEDSNPHDPNAVCIQIKGQTVGHLSRDYARQFRSMLGHMATWGVPIRCAAQIRGGWYRSPQDQGNFGVWLDFSG